MIAFFIFEPRHGHVCDRAKIVVLSSITKHHTFLFFNGPFKLNDHNCFNFPFQGNKTFNMGLKNLKKFSSKRKTARIGAVQKFGYFAKQFTTKKSRFFKERNKLYLRPFRSSQETKTRNYITSLRNKKIFNYHGIFR